MNQIGIFDITSRRHKNNPSSRAANPKQSSKAIIQGQILELLQVNKRLTGKEIALMLGKPFNAISGRFSELKAMAKIRGTGIRKDGSELLEVWG